MLTLRISGRNVDVDPLLAILPFDVAAVHRKGDRNILSSRPPLDGSTINIGVSNAEMANLNAQISDAEAFLHRYKEALNQIGAFPGVERLVLDFAIEDRNGFSQSDRFPASLLATMGALRIDLEISRYPASAEVENA